MKIFRKFVNTLFRKFMNTLVGSTKLQIDVNWEINTTKTIVIQITIIKNNKTFERENGNHNF